MSGICLPIDAVAGAPSFPAAQHRVAQAAMLTGRTDRPLGARSGVRPGSDPTVTVTATQWTVTPFNGVIDPATALTVGPFLFAFLANETGGVNAADQTNARIDRLDVQVPDDPAGASALAAVIVYTQGVAAATPTAPAAPVRSFPLGTISVPKAGAGSPSFTASWPRATASGGVTPARSSAEYPAHPFVGQYVDDATLGLLRWDGVRWIAVGIERCSNAAAYPVSPVVGQYVDDATLGLHRWDGATWRPVGRTLAGNVNLTANIAQTFTDVSFPAGYFTQPPVVVASTSQYDVQLAVGTSLTATLCRIYYKSSTNGEAFTLHWIATEPNS